MHIAASSKCCPGKALCPYEELQPVESRPCDALTVLRRAVSEDQEAHEHAGARSVGMHAPVAAPGAGLRAPSGALYQPHPHRRLLPKCYAFPRQTNHQQRKPTRPPTTTITATDIPAIAPEERCVLLPVLLLPVLT